MSDNSRVRVSMVGVVVVALFSALLARLWFLQMGPEQKLRAEAIALSTRVVYTSSPRGRILDRNGVVLARDRAAWAVTVDRTLSKSTHASVMGRLSEVLGIPEAALDAQYTSPRQSPLKPAIVALDVAQDKRLSLLEHPEDFPGVHVQQLTVRTYPEGNALGDPALAAQVLGYVGEIGPDQLATLKRRGYQPGDSIGRDGIEAAYESFLHGAPERVTVQIDPTGKEIGAPVSVDPGSVGDDVQLTIDAKIQHAAEVALAQGIGVARTQQDHTYTAGFRTLAAPGGAVVVLDARDGSVVAMASNPAFPPERWVGGISQTDFAALNDPAGHYPLVNRATQGQYAPGSTFKLVSSVATTRYGIRGAFQYYDDQGFVLVGADKQRFSNDNSVAYGPVDLSQALTRSSDTYFYTAGSAFWDVWHRGDTNAGLGMQQVAREFGFGAKTGVELDEATGRIPDPAWRRAFADANYKTATERADYGSWRPGDEVHLAVGQGDVLVTPLQLADAYAAFANGGTVWEPHLAKDVVDPVTKKVVRVLLPKARSHVALDPTVRQQMLLGFEGAVDSQKGTAYAAFQGFPFQTVPVAGKTGTAQVANKGDTSVFASFFPADNPQYVVVALVEEAGHGAEIAAPIARQVIESIVGLPPTPIKASGGND